MPWLLHCQIIGFKWVHQKDWNTTSHPSKHICKGPSVNLHLSKSANTDWQLLQPILPFPMVPSSSQGDCQLSIGSWLQLTIGNCLFQWLQLAVKEVSSHEKLKGNLGGNRELRDLSGGVGVPDASMSDLWNIWHTFTWSCMWNTCTLSGEHGLGFRGSSPLMQELFPRLKEILLYLIGLILCKLARTREHCLKHKILGFYSHSTARPYLREPPCVFSAITLMVPEVRAWSLATINSCPSLLISFTYLNSATGILFDFRTKNLHGIRTLTASINLFSSVHGTVCCAHPRFLPNL